MSSVLIGLTWVLLLSALGLSAVSAFRPIKWLGLEDRKHAIHMVYGMLLLILSCAIHSAREHPSWWGSLSLLFIYGFGVWLVRRITQPGRKSHPLALFIVWVAFIISVSLAVGGKETSLYWAAHPEEYAQRMADDKAKIVAQQQKQAQEKALTAQKHAAQQASQQEAKAVQERAKAFESLAAELETITGFDTAVCKKQPDLCLHLINVFSHTFKAAKESAKTEDDQQKVKQFRAALVGLQKKALPLIRSAYGAQLSKKLWEFNLSARAIGKGFTTMELTGPLLIANRNISDLNTKVVPELLKMRFKRTQYLWHNQRDEYTYFDLTSFGTSDDSIVITWDDSSIYPKEVK